MRRRNQKLRRWSLKTWLLVMSGKTSKEKSIGWLGPIGYYVNVLLITKIEATGGIGMMFNPIWVCDAWKKGTCSWSCPKILEYAAWKVSSKDSELHLYVRIVNILVGIKLSEDEQYHWEWERKVKRRKAQKNRVPRRESWAIYQVRGEMTERFQ